MTELWKLSASDLVALVRARSVSATEVCLASLSRLEEVNPRINAIVDYCRDEALAEASHVDATIARGGDAGALAGVPVTIKVQTDQKGHVTSNGATIQRDFVAVNDSPVVNNFRKAGAIILGRTNVPAFSLRWFTDNRLYGRTINPHDPARTPGGSSGGAAAGLASGIGQIAHGADIAGSIRYPAYACGVHGLRPTIGRVPQYGEFAPERSIGVQITAVSGPLARTMDDLRLALKVMAKGDPRDPWWVPAPLVGPKRPKTAALCARPDGLQTSPDIVEAITEAGKRLRDAGWVVDEIADIPPLREAADLQTRLWLGENYEAMLRAAEREGDIGALTCLIGARRRIAAHVDVTLADVLTRRATMIRDWQLFFEKWSVMVLPVSAELPFCEGLDLRDDRSFERVWDAQMPMIGIPFVGVPALSVASGKIGCVPMGVQVASARYREDLCLLAGEVVAAARGKLMPIDPN